MNAQETADLLRDVDFALSHGMTALVAFGDRHYAEAIERDFARMNRARSLIRTALTDLPPAIPLSEDQMTKVGRVIGAVLDKRFGVGSQAAVDAALSDWVDPVATTTEATS